MKLYTVAVYNLRICMKEDNPSQNYFKGDNKLCSRSGGYPYVILLTVLVFNRMEYFYNRLNNFISYFNLERRLYK